MKKKIGLIIFSIGITYMILVAWLSSWWYVPDYRQFGIDSVKGLSFYKSMTFFIIWSVSAPLGAILVLFGFALYANVEKNRLIIFGLVSLLLLWWLGMWYVTSLPSILFGIGGGIIICCFTLSVWSWAKKRAHLEGHNKLAGDIRVLGHLFFLISAWGICGVLGTPAFGLRPELMIEFKHQVMAYTLGAKVMVDLILGWVCLAVSQYLGSHWEKIKV